MVDDRGSWKGTAHHLHRFNLPFQRFDFDRLKIDLLLKVSVRSQLLIVPRLERRNGYRLRVSQSYFEFVFGGGHGTETIFELVPFLLLFVA